MREDREEFVARVREVVPDYDEAALVEYERTGRDALMERWYASVERGEPDFSVYDGVDYLGECYSCWIGYSRPYLRMMSRKPIATRVRTVLDVGCGIGDTTLGLSQLYPEATVVGTQLPGTLQYELASRYGEETRRFSIEADPVGPVDLLFASEYFEHFPRPIDELLRVVREAEPRLLVIANAFGARSIGHFPLYRHAGKTYSNKAVGRAFGATLRSLGYRRIDNGFWNGRPSYWTRNGGGK